MRFALLAALACLTGCNALWVDRMKLQPKYLPYAASRFYPDGAAMREPPAGTLAREAAVGPSSLTEGWIEPPEGGFTGTFVARIPLPVDAALLDAGRRRFSITCAACHGPLGDGVSVVASKMALRLPPSLLSERVRTIPDGRLFEIISEGYGLMPPYADVIALRERWAVVAFVRALELSQRAPLTLVPEPERRRLLGGGS
ncbi:MAG: c-type cytochrome [Myxococcales bacterium]